MTATTSGLSDYNFDLSDICEEAYARCGSELRSGWDMKSARRSLNLLLMSWSNIGLNLWALDQQTIPLVTGQVSYTIPIDTVDILDAVIRTGTALNQIDISITRISESTYLSIPNKNTQGRPIQFWLNRLSGATYPITGVAAPTVYIWPTASAPDGQYTLVYYRLRRLQNAGDGANTQDIPFRFLPALISGLAYFLSPKIPGIDANRAQMLKTDYQEQLGAAMAEDRDKSSYSISPRMYR